MSRRVSRVLAEVRGSVLLFTIVALVFILIMGGFAVDFAHQVTAKNEVQRSMDAAALAGASQLNWTPARIEPARALAIQYAAANPSRDGAIALGSAAGSIQFGTWDSSTNPPFTPSADPIADAGHINAIACQYGNPATDAVTIRTSFLNLLGISSLRVAARAVAVFGPPATIPRNECLFPIGVSQCPFQTDGRYGPQGAGQPVSTFSPTGTNVAAWINVTGSGTPSASGTRAAIAAAAAGACHGSSLRAGDSLGAQNGMVQSVFDEVARCNPGLGTDCRGYFVDKFNAGTTYTVKRKDENGNETVAYTGHGWEVIVPVIQTPCPGTGPINQDMRILTFSKIVITQVINRGWCTVDNASDSDPGGFWRSKCPPPIGTAVARDSNFNAIIGYFNVTTMETEPVPDPGVPAGLATRHRLVP